MSPDRTEPQGQEQKRRSEDLSLKPMQPPAQVPGYETQRLMGTGAYGEVWGAVDRNTGRRVAIKFFTHRSGLDWSHLSREVEKLVFLSADRYVVQLLDVGWDADPPYYVMEYIEHGSLADRLDARGPLPVGEAVSLFHDVATGLMHAHGKGILHCDLKPANVMLDEDTKPRLADFGQSRLTDEQTPSLGTMFYMAPEQADLKAVPDTCWDVYGLGALLYCMLVGSPPHREEESVRKIEEADGLQQRLAVYRELIQNSPPPSKHRHAAGVDQALVEIIDRCLETDPNRRFPNVQLVLDALETRARRRARRPLVILGAIGPALLLIVIALFALWGFDTVVQRTDQALSESELQTNRYFSKYVAEAAASELERRFRAVEDLAKDPEFQKLLKKTLQDPELKPLRDKLNDPDLDKEALESLRKNYVEYLDREPLQQLQQVVTRLFHDKDQPKVASWFINDDRGLQLAREPVSQTIGKNYAWRTYFHGLTENGVVQDKDPKWRPKDPEDRLYSTKLSAVFISQATGRWIVTVSTPVEKEGPGGEFLGIVALTVEVGQFIELQAGSRTNSQDIPDQFAVLVDWRKGPNKGLILQHPLFEKKLPARFKDFRVKQDDLPETTNKQENYRDPLATAPEGGAYNKRWLAADQAVRVRGEDTGWRVIVQKSYDEAIGRNLKDLKRSLVAGGLAALALVALVVTCLWALVIRLLGPARIKKVT